MIFFFTSLSNFPFFVNNSSDRNKVEVLLEGLPNKLKNVYSFNALNRF